MVVGTNCLLGTVDDVGLVSLEALSGRCWYSYTTFVWSLNRDWGETFLRQRVWSKVWERAFVSKVRNRDYLKVDSNSRLKLNLPSHLGKDSCL